MAVSINQQNCTLSKSFLSTPKVKEYRELEPSIIATTNFCIQFSKSSQFLEIVDQTKSLQSNLLKDKFRHYTKQNMTQVKIYYT